MARADIRKGSKSMDIQLTGPIALALLALKYGADVDAPAFRRAVWQAIERFRGETGRQLRIHRGEVVECDPRDQVEWARRAWRKAATKERRAQEVASGVLSRDDAEQAARAERLLHAITGAAPRQESARRHVVAAEQAASLREALAADAKRRRGD